MQLQKERDILEEKNEQLENENGELYRLYRKYLSGEMNLSEAEKNGYILPGSKVIKFDVEETEVELNKNSVLAKLYSKNIQNIKVIRILWLIISAFIVIILLFPVIKRNSPE